MGLKATGYTIGRPWSMSPGLDRITVSTDRLSKRGAERRKHRQSRVPWYREDQMTAQPSAIGFTPNEDPFVVQHGGFYRRWLSMLDDIEELKAIVARIEATTEDKWVPLWQEAGK